MLRSIHISLLILGILFLTPSIGSVQDNEKTHWSQDLSPEQKRKAKQIIKDAHPRIKELRKEVRKKITALEEFCFKEAEDEQNLAQLGQELQKAREALRQELMNLDATLIQEVGVSIRGYRGRSSAHLSKDPPQEAVILHKHSIQSSHHSEQ